MTMAGEKLGTTKCDCGDGGTVEWSASKQGGVSGKCLGCGEQRFKRSPKAAENIKRQLAGAAARPAAAAASTEKKTGGGVLGEAFDLSKL